MIYSNAKRPHATPEKNGGKCRVEKAGYIPAKRRIEEMIGAGHRLNAFRKEQYDIVEGSPVKGVEIDPTRKPGLDLAEATILGREAQYRLKQQKDAARAEKTRLEAEKKAVETASKSPV